MIQQYSMAKAAMTLESVLRASDTYDPAIHLAVVAPGADLSHEAQTLAAATNSVDTAATAAIFTWTFRMA